MSLERKKEDAQLVQQRVRGGGNLRMAKKYVHFNAKRQKITFLLGRDNFFTEMYSTKRCYIKSIYLQLKFK